MVLFAKCLHTCTFLPAEINKLSVFEHTIYIYLQPSSAPKHTLVIGLSAHQYILVLLKLDLISKHLYQQVIPLTNVSVFFCRRW